LAVMASAGPLSSGEAKRTEDPQRPCRKGGVTGSVVGIQFEVGGMYTGTIITDLMAAVDRAERRALENRIADDRELHEIFAMQIPVTEGDGLLVGAA